MTSSSAEPNCFAACAWCALRKRHKAAMKAIKRLILALNSPQHPPNSKSRVRRMSVALREVGRCWGCLWKAVGAQEPCPGAGTLLSLWWLEQG